MTEEIPRFPRFVTRRGYSYVEDFEFNKQRIKEWRRRVKAVLQKRIDFAERAIARAKKIDEDILSIDIKYWEDQKEIYKELLESLK